MLRKTQFLDLIKHGQFKRLFIEELAWEKYRSQATLPVITVDNTDYHIETIAIRSGFQILLCYVDELPSQSIVKKIDVKLRKQAEDYICIFRQKNSINDIWVVPVRTNEKRDIVIVESYHGNAEAIWQKINGITFGFDEKTNIVDLRHKVQGAFAINSEKITKEFYTGFKKEHKTFAEFITGIDDHISVKENKNKQWYTSVMLNRLMFCYFIQKKGFLNFDTEYLRNKLNMVRQEQGENRFFSSFYRGFLSNLFHDGLNTPLHNQEFIDKYGKIPYLNGGMFDEHQLEKDYVDIDIADEAFIRLFDFFDKWKWHLDTRITSSGKDINPDVLGYIFEQYINDRAQMGAYYTKEDITEYIGRNCILPFLFDETKRIANDDGGYFAPGGFVWNTLRKSGDRYIFDAVKKGYKDFDDIPENIHRGIITDAMRNEYAELPVSELPEGHVPLAELRADWNTRTPEQWGLPTEIWRETIERLQRCGDLLHKIDVGEITSINDFITYNLDIRRFAHDLLADADSRFVGRFYQALQKVTILDPTCGSGAFLFAAMNILEPLYEICIERMQEFHNQNPKLFEKQLTEITDKYRSNIQYFIYKSIILRNLYGVDIMVEATEIAKLRLFLKMVAVVDVDRRAPNLGLDPLPDIDFNIRCGNTLIGYANKDQLHKDLNDSQGSFDVMLANEEFKEHITEEMQKVSRAYDIFKDVQLSQAEDMLTFKQAKTNLRARLAALNDKLNRRLYLATVGFTNNQGVDFTATQAYLDWLASHQPFHWLAEFYQIIEGNNGFDVIIGNPPYVTQRANQLEKLKLPNFVVNSGNLYSSIIYRCKLIISRTSFFGMIVPISYISTSDHKAVRNYIEEKYTPYYSSYDIRPAHLFEGAAQRLTIFISIPKYNNIIFCEKQIRWYSDTRDMLFNLIKYESVRDTSTGLYRSSTISSRLLKMICEDNQASSIYGKDSIWMATTANNFIKAYFTQPRYSSNGESKEPSGWRQIWIASNQKQSVSAIINSSLFYYIWKCTSDGFNVTKGFTTNLLSRIYNISLKLQQLGNKLNNALDLNSETHVRNQKTTGRTEIQLFRVKPCKPIIDEIDWELAKHYGFTEEELDFIINYDIKYRMGDELNNEK